MTTEDAAFWEQVGQLRDAAAMLERRDARLVAEVRLLREQLGYALDALEGHPATGWTINDARQALVEGLAVMSPRSV